MKKPYFKYIAPLFLFGSNGIVASYILLSSTEIVFTDIDRQPVSYPDLFIFGKKGSVR